MRTVSEWIDWAARRFEAAGLHYGHGTDNSGDEAAWLVLHAIGKSLNAGDDIGAEVVDRSGAEAIEKVVDERIERRCPAAYLTGTSWFAGLEFEVGPQVLVPRSPIAELIEDGFEPWIEADAVRSILDLGTGSGCIAIACAMRFAAARVVASDISEGALAVAGRNVERHGVADRVKLVHSDLFDSLGQEKYDLIVSNPPYVPHRRLRDLPGEFRAEPAVGLVSGMEGLEIPLRIIARAGRHLGERGILVCEVGESRDGLQQALSKVPFLWLEFSSGGEGVFLLEQPQMDQAGAAAAALLRER